MADNHVQIGKSCFNDVSGFLEEHRHGTNRGSVDGYVTMIAGTQVFLACRFCGIVQTADEVDAGNLWVELAGEGA